MSGRNSELIRAALEVAPSFKVAADQGLATLAHPEYPHDIFPAGFDPSISLPGSILAGSVEELEALLKQANETTNGRLSHAEIHKEAIHESQHAQAARYLGATALHVGVRLGHVYNRDGNSTRYAGARFQPFVFATFKDNLEFNGALTAAYPEILSPGDIQTLDMLGYTVDSLAAIARKRNRWHRESLPLPLSASKK